MMRTDLCACFLAACLTGVFCVAANADVVQYPLPGGVNRVQTAFGPDESIEVVSGVVFFTSPADVPAGVQVNAGAEALFGPEVLIGPLNIAPNGVATIFEGEYSGLITNKGTLRIGGGHFVETIGANWGGNSPDNFYVSKLWVFGGQFDKKFTGIDYRPQIPAAALHAASAVSGLAEAVETPPQDEVVIAGGHFEEGFLLLLADDPAPALNGLVSGSGSVETSGLPPILTFIGQGLFVETETENYHHPDYPGRVFSLSVLGGTLADGTVLNNVPLIVERGIDPTIVLSNVPEPATLLMAGLAVVVSGVILRARRRRT